MALTAKERVDRYRQRKQELLLCIEPGCWESSPDAERCADCAEAFNRRRREQYAAKTEAA